MVSRPPDNSRTTDELLTDELQNGRRRRRGILLTHVGTAMGSAEAADLKWINSKRNVWQNEPSGLTGIKYGAYQMPGGGYSLKFVFWFSIRS